MTRRMSPEAQVRLGKAMQLTGILALMALLAGLFGMGTDFVKGQDISAVQATTLFPLVLIYSMTLSMLGDKQVKKGRARQAEAREAEAAAVKRAEEAAAIEAGPELCRTGGAHIYLGADTTCFNGCGTNRDEVKSQVQAP